jgi:hypothetical protein
VKDELSLCGTNQFWVVLLDLTIFLNFLNFEFFSNASQNKLCVSTNFMILGATDQKLWMFENFRRSLSRAGMC